MKRRDFVAAGAGAAVSVVGFGKALPAERTSVVQFDFHSNFWMNLHHRLYREAATIELKRDGEKLRGQGPKIYADLARVPQKFRAPWNVALGLYRLHYVAKDLLFDREMSSIKRILTRTDRNQPPSALHLPKVLLQALTTAAPIYRATLWPEDNASNLAWIAAVHPLIDRHGQSFF